MRRDLAWAKADIIDLLPDFTVAQASDLGRSMFAAACDRQLTPQQNLDVLDTIRAGLGYYEVRADGDEAWRAVVMSWRQDQRVYEQKVLRDQLTAVEVFTEEHLGILMDPERNTVLNNLGLGMKADAFYAAHPGTRRATNYGGRTYLFSAAENCRHAVKSAPGGGVKCGKCPGWFCF
jgi:hypothetical protein